MKQLLEEASCDDKIHDVELQVRTVFVDILHIHVFLAALRLAFE